MGQAIGFGRGRRRGGGFGLRRKKHGMASMAVLTVSAVVAILAVGLLDPADVPGLTAPPGADSSTGR